MLRDAQIIADMPQHADMPLLPLLFFQSANRNWLHRLVTSIKMVPLKVSMVLVDVSTSGPLSE